jgi:hypothetical protein
MKMSIRLTQAKALKLAWGIFVDQEVLKLHPFSFTKRVGFINENFSPPLIGEKFFVLTPMDQVD